jgi:predicted acyltransferase
MNKLSATRTVASPGTGRIAALDILRGITVAGMIMVNNPGTWSNIYEPLGHASWIGLTPTDLVFPFFMFIMGISTFISLRRFDFRPRGTALLKIFRRAAVIFLIGVGIAWLSLSIRTWGGLGDEGLGTWERLWRAVTNFERLRILGVLQRLALTYLITALVAVFVRHKHIPWIIAASLVGYFLMLLFGHGFEFSEENIVSVVDRAVLGVGHMYRDGGLAIDPEGLLSTIPAAAHVLIGFLCGRTLLDASGRGDGMKRLFIVGASLTFAGFLLSYGCPISKKLWTPTFVAVTCGMASTLLALLIWIVDERGWRRWSGFFVSFGVNPLFIYVTAAVLSIVLGATGARGFIWNSVLVPVFGDGKFGSLVFALLFVGLCRVIGYILYKKKIYIKI